MTRATTTLALVLAVAFTAASAHAQDAAAGESAEPEAAAEESIPDAPVSTGCHSPSDLLHTPDSLSSSDW